MAINLRDRIQFTVPWNVARRACCARGHEVLSRRENRERLAVCFWLPARLFRHLYLEVGWEPPRPGSILYPLSDSPFPDHE